MATKIGEDLYIDMPCDRCGWPDLVYVGRELPPQELVGRDPSPEMIPEPLAIFGQCVRCEHKNKLYDLKITIRQK